MPCEAKRHLTQETTGNGLLSNHSFDVQTGRLNTILAGTGNMVQNFSYSYDVLGSVLTRADANECLRSANSRSMLSAVVEATPETV